MDGSATSAKRAAMLLLLDSDSSESESSSTDTSNSSESDSDAKGCAYEREFNKLFRIPAKRPKVVGFIEDVVRQYSDHEFRRHFRLARPVAEKLVVEFAVSSMCPSSTQGGVQAKSAETHVLTFIWYAANKICMRNVASRFDMSESTVYRVLKRVAQFLMTLGPSVIKFPADLEDLTSSFEKHHTAAKVNAKTPDKVKYAVHELVTDRGLEAPLEVFIMAAFSGVAFYGVNRNRKRPRVSDETAERILERIAGTATSDIDLSDSDDDTLVDTTFSAPVDTLSSEENENSDDERPSTSKTTKGQS
ncbi:hypothetical protein HPB51_025456 [Rhipicephalus microplus]|uniref:Nuclease HARBI1 n=1 Tax=Rhipicephalus microplus TaxID=6941 RepID=A0A9J6DRD9_RHIMP|nr:hypothetical protein HPB51_025456 [Rhipicephalus microplus]